MTLDLRHPALVVIDVQNTMHDPTWGPRNKPEAEARIASLLAKDVHALALANIHGEYATVTSAADVVAAIDAR